MAVTDQEIIKNTVYRLLENGNADATATTLLTNQFSLNEIIDSMNRVQQKFLLDTGMIVTQGLVAGVVSQEQYDTPVDNILVRRVTWAYV